VLGGEPVFEGTRMPVARLAGLIVKRLALGEIAEDYHDLDVRAHRLRGNHAKMKRNPGRPRPPLRLRRTMILLS